MIQFVPTEKPKLTACPVAPRQDDPPYQKGEPAALFIPCYIDQFYPADRPGDGRLLQRQGVPMVFPDEQTCCGQPAFNSGYWEEARRVIRHFCDVFAKYRWIVCPSASCTAMCRVFFEQVDPDPRDRGRRPPGLRAHRVPRGHLGRDGHGGHLPAQGDPAQRLSRPARAGRGRRRRWQLLRKRPRHDLLRAAQRRRVLRLRRHLQREDARHLAGHGPDQGGEHRPERRRGGRVAWTSVA